MKTEITPTQKAFRDIVKGKDELSLLTGSIRHGLTLSVMIDTLEEMKITDPNLIAGLRKAAGSRVNKQLKTSSADKLAAAILGYGRTNQMFAEYKQAKNWQCVTVGMSSVSGEHVEVPFYAPSDIDLTFADMDMVYGGGLWEVHVDSDDYVDILHTQKPIAPPKKLPPHTTMTTEDVAAVHLHFDGFICHPRDIATQMQSLLSNIRHIRQAYDTHLTQCNFHILNPADLINISTVTDALTARLTDEVGAVTLFQAGNGQMYLIDSTEMGGGKLQVNQVIGFPQIMRNDVRFKSLYSKC